MSDKDAEIDRLNQAIIRHEASGSKLAADNMNLQQSLDAAKSELAEKDAEIERLQRVVDVAHDIIQEISNDPEILLNHHADDVARFLASYQTQPARQEG